jgi:hypothetical protein
MGVAQRTCPWTGFLPRMGVSDVEGSMSSEVGGNLDTKDALELLEGQAAGAA